VKTPLTLNPTILCVLPLSARPQMISPLPWPHPSLLLTSMDGEIVPWKNPTMSPYLWMSLPESSDDLCQKVAVPRLLLCLRLPRSQDQELNGGAEGPSRSRGFVVAEDWRGKHRLRHTAESVFLLSSRARGRREERCGVGMRCREVSPPIVD